MPKYEKLTCDEVKDEEFIQNRRRTIGLIPYILLLVLILTLVIGVFYTYQGIQAKLKEEINYHKQIAIIQNTNVEISEELIELQNKRVIVKKTNEDQQKIISTLESKISVLKKSNLEMKNNWNNFDKEHDFQITLDSLSKINSELEGQLNDLNNNQRLLKKKLKLKSERLTEVQSNILGTEGELKHIEEWLKGKKINKKCYFNDIDPNQPKIFHNSCDNITPTLILYKTKTFDRFGAFTSKSWDGHQGIKDPHSFLFSINHMEQFSFNGRCPNGVLITQKELLPSFGESPSKYDLLIEEKHGELIAYSRPFKCFGETEGETGTLFGTNQTEISFIEVYSLK